MNRAQKGRKPRKSWHRADTERVWTRADASWPDLGVGRVAPAAPAPLRQGQAGWRAGRRLRRS